MVDYNGFKYKIESKLYCPDLNEWKYYLSKADGVAHVKTYLTQPVSEEKLKEI